MMKQAFLISVLFLLACLFTSFDEKSVPDVKDYIDKYKDIAIEEMHRSGIPASITLAQGLHESGIGKGKLALNSNNHFGIKCKKDWGGESFYWKDDDRINGKLIESCFRVYSNVWQSYYDHTNFLLNNERYHRLFELDRTNYVEWAKGLKECGYATDERYADKLIKTIKQYQLFEFDIEEESELLNNDEAYDEIISKIEEPNNIPAAEQIPENYKRDMYAAEEIKPQIEETANEFENLRSNTILEIPPVNNDFVVENGKEEKPSMLIPEEAEEPAIITSQEEQIQLAPSYNIAAFPTTSMIPSESSKIEKLKPVTKPSRSRNNLIQMVRKPRISRRN